MRPRPDRLKRHTRSLVAIGCIAAVFTTLWIRSYKRETPRLDTIGNLVGGDGPDYLCFYRGTRLCTVGSYKGCLCLNYERLMDPESRIDRVVPISVGHVLAFNEDGRIPYAQFSNLVEHPRGVAFRQGPNGWHFWACGFGYGYHELPDGAIHGINAMRQWNYNIPFWSLLSLCAAVALLEGNRLHKAIRSRRRIARSVSEMRLRPAHAKIRPRRRQMPGMRHPHPRRHRPTSRENGITAPLALAPRRPRPSLYWSFAIGPSVIPLLFPRTPTNPLGIPPNRAGNHPQAAP